VISLLDLRVEDNKEYDYDLDLNWRDDGDDGQGKPYPTMNDYHKGYQEKPYEFVQWAKKNNKNIRTAAMEVINMHFYPEFLADYILTLWNGVDGSLQNFYEGFTLRYNNNLKQAIAKELKNKGYTVYPVLVDDRAFYAKRLNTIVRKANHVSLDVQLSIAETLFNSEALKLCLGEVRDIREMNQPVSIENMNEMLAYYQELFPQDYAISMTKDLINRNLNKENFKDLYNDFNITNDSLKSMELMLGENRDPFDNPYYGGEDFGYNYITKMRGFDGVKPEQYEIKASFKKKD